MKGQGSDEFTIQEIAECFRLSNLSEPNASRLRKNLKKNSATLPGSNSDAFRLRLETQQRLDDTFVDQDQAPPSPQTPLNPLATALSDHAARLQSEETREFVQEAISCMRHGEHRAAIVLSWIGAVSLLQQVVTNEHLKEFNDDAIREGVIKRPIKNVGDLSKLRESEFLNVLERISVISNAVKKELLVCLGRRNNCGHPNDVRIGEAQVAAHIESLIQHVFERIG